MSTSTPPRVGSRWPEAARSLTGVSPRHTPRTGDRYGADVLATDWRAPARGRSREVAVEKGMVLEEATSDWCGEVVGIDRDLGTVTLEDRRARRRVFPLGPGFLLEGAPVILRPPSRSAPARPTRTASGSRTVEGARARVARASRIWVEGRHDAELVEKVWGDDLRLEGVVVEPIDGVDELPARLDALGPGPGSRVGVLVDHLVDGSKESRIADAVAGSRHGPHVLVTGHPFVDIWQAVRPDRLGMSAWPTIPREVEWKRGVCRHLGWAHRDQADIAQAWKRVLGVVGSYQDLEPALLGRVEELIDFVTAEDS